MLTRFYIAGPMAGLPNHNYPAFFDAEVALEEYLIRYGKLTRDQFLIYNPATFRHQDHALSWEQCLKEDIPTLVKCDIVLLLEGWQLSKGAQLEKFIASHLGLRVYELKEYFQSVDYNCFSKDVISLRTMAWSNINFDLLYNQVVNWQFATFGKRSNPKPPIHHLAKEVNELLENPTDLSEYADCFFLLFNAAAEAGYTSEQLLIAIADKLEVNRKRKWGKADSDGVVEHIK